MVGPDVEQDRAIGRERERVLELKRARLADDGRVRAEPACERRQRGADVAGDRHREPGLAVDVAEQLDGRRLAVRAGDRDELVGQQAPAELELAQHGDPALARRRDHRRLAWDAGRLHDRARVREEGEAVGLAVRLDAVGQRRRAGVDRDDALTTLQQRPRRRHARPRQPDDEPRAGRKGGRLRRYAIDCLVDREADRAADRGDDPEAQDDLRLRPAEQLEVVVDRRHQEDGRLRNV